MISPLPNDQMPAMARKNVDLPTPEGPITRVDSCGISARSPTWASLRPSGSLRSRSGIDRTGPVRCGDVDPGPLFLVGAGARESLLEGGQTLDRGAEGGEAGVAVDEEVHRRVDVREGVGRLVEGAEVDLLHHEIEGRDHDIGNDRRDLGIELEERVQERPTRMIR